MKKGTVCPKTEESNGKILYSDGELGSSIITPDLLSRCPVKATETSWLLDVDQQYGGRTKTRGSHPEGSQNQRDWRQRKRRIQLVSENRQKEVAIYRESATDAQKASDF